MNNHIKLIESINEKVDKIIHESLSQENKAFLTDNEDSEILPQPDPSDKMEFFLILDLDETLVHFFEDDNEAYVKVLLDTENFNCNFYSEY